MGALLQCSTIHFKEEVSTYGIGLTITLFIHQCTILHSVVHGTILYTSSIRKKSSIEY